MSEVAIEHAISQATTDVLGKMFFTGFTSESDAIAKPDPRIAVRVGFDGERRGQLVLHISTSCARTLAADFLGTEGDDGPDEVQVNEVVRELANMICGDALSALERGALRLAAPEILPSDFALPAVTSQRSFELGEGSLTVGLAFEGGGHA